MHQMWRLSEAGPRNLGLVCTDDGLLLGRTSLIERRDGPRLGRTLHENFPVIDKIPDGVAACIKSIDLNAATYQDAAV
jgi:hypothetical protein